MKPTFSIIVPAHDDQMATARTLSNLIDQDGKYDREIIVVSDGPNREIAHVCKFAQKAANNDKQPARVKHIWTPSFVGSGNPGRAMALEQAQNEWVIFIDSGTSVLHHTFWAIHAALAQAPDSDLVLWDIIHMVDPVPFTALCGQLRFQLEKESVEKIGYVIPGVSAAVKREIGQRVKWPHVRMSDWTYWSAVWKILDKPAKVAFIHNALVIAYGAYDNKRVRFLHGRHAWKIKDFEMSYDEWREKHPELAHANESLPGTSSTGQTGSEH